MKNTPYQQAVALEYGKNKTPVVSAKGEGELARRIIAEAKRQGVYVSEDPRLLAMLSRLDVDHKQSKSVKNTAPSNELGNR